MSDQFEEKFIGDVDPENQPYANAENAEIDAEYIEDVAERDEMLLAIQDDADSDEYSEDDDDFDDDEESEGESDLATEFAAVFADATPAKPVIVMEELPVTGEPRVDDALARLNDLASLPVSEHVAVFEDVQRRLHETLSDLSGQ